MIWKILGAILGYYFTRSIWGAFAGYFIASLFTRSNEAESTARAYTSSYDTTGTRGDTYTSGSQTTARDNFLYSLMALSAHIIQADGRIMHSEMEFVRQFLRTNFDETTVTKCNDLLLRFFDYKKRNGQTAWERQILTSCYTLAQSMPDEFRQQLIAYLCQIAKADGRVDEKEIEALHLIARNLHLDETIIEQTLNLGGTPLDQAYKVLGITPDATDDEVRRAYKRMAQKHHPDLVSNLGDDVRRAAEQKFQEIGNAKDLIYQARGMKR